MRRILGLMLKIARNKLSRESTTSIVFDVLACIVWVETRSQVCIDSLGYAKGLVGEWLLDVMGIPSINDKILYTKSLEPNRHPE